MYFNTENAIVSIYCRETGRNISFSCNYDLDHFDIENMMCFFEHTMSTDAARDLAYDFDMFHGHVNYDRVVVHSTNENDLLRKISYRLSRAGYDLYIDNISYE